MKIGRNDPCACGSGRKYKRCCLERDETAHRKQPISEAESSRIEPQAEQEAIYSEAAALMKTGRTAIDDDVLAIAERHRQSIDRWFYPCSHQAHGALAALYESDARFASAIDQHSPGLATFLITAIRANADRT